MIVNYDDDIWRIPATNNYSITDYNFEFGRFKSPTLKMQVKDYMYAHLKRDVVEHSTLHRYCYSLQHFANFIESNEIWLSYFSELTPLMIDQFILYLKRELKSPKTMVVAFSALKSVVRFGQFLQSEKYPPMQIFPDSPCRIFGIEDTLTTKCISNFVMIQINQALKKEQDILLKTCLLIAKETGLRLSEILLLEEGCVMEDFLGSPILFTFSPKIDDERAVVISTELLKVVNELNRYTKEFRKKNNTLLLFVRKAKKKCRKEIVQYNQSIARSELRDFKIRNKIVDESGQIADFTFHSFRHTLGTDMINNGMSPIDVRSQLGHVSMHSTGIYARVSNTSLQNEYAKLGFIGISEKTLSDVYSISEKVIAEEKKIQGALPDGICTKVFEGETHCSKFNMCLFCDKYRTFIKDLPTHKEHLERLRKDRIQYMSEMSIGNQEFLQRIEDALVTIIERLETLACT
ncbi:tyrosine-type recombinase/integrase [Ruminiclostridium cellulolyticum]|uniref:Integrase family protein n=1 Tax=Ruminiclostridium cellulolyticum (strain ATCC 35319 / DSM 5812 / JCM 6584 / H10) TaxID=394503 RepID=B8I4A2_RUMCH|nr:tyrosine-type recombinase/integrase [Ruminiclostridium cellulolyticum]ACL74456.1 integrase family protein [Ruminiclostridium cellulolyticum H10]